VKKSRFTDEQIAFTLKQAEPGNRIDEICRKMGISDATFYKWRSNFGYMITALSLNACPYLATFIFHRCSTDIGFIEATTILAWGGRVIQCAQLAI